ncbi:MAG: hypothetical protein EBX40_07470, partial [Gammaproteobacteria bacterium]|nr:hypothetical protein [Gammaproteobacteria bacterium]
AETTQSTGLTSFASTGFSIGALAKINTNAATYVSWTFRKQPKFFDVVTYTGTGSPQNISHNLGSVPGFIIVKRYDGGSEAWNCYHRSLGNNSLIYLNYTDGAFTPNTNWNNTTPTSTVFTVSGNSSVNQSGASFVAYLFAHDAGGFGLTGTDNVISCGSFTHSFSTDSAIQLGWEPQWVMFKEASSTGSWQIFDNMRGLSETASANLRANQSSPENALTPPSGANATSTGFVVQGQAVNTGTIIYIAIRRGPMKVPTSGTGVYYQQATSTNDDAGTLISINSSFPPDLAINCYRSGSGGTTRVFNDRLRGWATGSNSVTIQSYTTASESDFGTSDLNRYLANNMALWVKSGGGIASYISYVFRRAPGFFDEVCYKGDNQATRSLSHNLGVPPEIIIVKNRSNAGGYSWTVWYSGMPTNNYLSLNGSSPNTAGFQYIGSTQTAATFSLVSNDPVVNGSSTNTYVAYLFATCAGVSKVGSYT